MAAYRDVLPADSDQPRIAYHFQGDYDSESRGNAELVSHLNASIGTWRDRWQEAEEGLPALEIAELDEDTFLLVDTRQLAGTLEVEFLDRPQAHAALVGAPAGAEAAAWALERKACVELDGRVVPLATADATLLRSLESAGRSARAAQRTALPLAPNG
jgi:hypothetical protein